MEEDAKGLEVYLFWNQDEKCTGINMGVTEPPSPGLNYQLCYTPEDMGEKENYDLVNGIILKDISGHWYAAVWNERCGKYLSDGKVGDGGGRDA